MPLRPPTRVPRLTPPQRRVLLRIAESQPVDARTLAAALESPPASVSRSVHALADRQLVTEEIIPTSPGPPRWRLTEYGRATIRNLPPETPDV